MAKLKVLIIGIKEDKKILLNYLNLKSYEIIFHDEDKRNINLRYFNVKVLFYLIKFFSIKKITSIILVYQKKTFYIFFVLFHQLNQTLLSLLMMFQRFIILLFLIFLI